LEGSKITEEDYFSFYINCDRRLPGTRVQIELVPGMGICGLTSLGIFADSCQLQTTAVYCPLPTSCGPAYQTSQCVTPLVCTHTLAPTASSPSAEPTTSTPTVLGFTYVPTSAPPNTSPVFSMTYPVKEGIQFGLPVGSNFGSGVSATWDTDLGRKNFLQVIYSTDITVLE
jgi:hypothetical protein